MPLSFMDETVTVIRPGVKTVRGSAVPDWTSATEHEVGRCQITSASTVQDRDGRVLNVSDRLTLRAPYGADIQAGDRIVHGGKTYEIDGDVSNTKSPTRRVSNLKCTLALWKG